MFSDFLMKSKKSKTTKSKKTVKKPSKKKSKKSLDSTDNSGIVLIDDELEVDAEKELEERKAYLEEARSQDSGD
jgi:translation elongation factor P/translation initiation factor 5A